MVNRQDDQGFAQLNQDNPALTESEPSSSPKGGDRGFAAMSIERQREIASKGGKAAHQKGTAHEFSSEEARQAGRKGGEAVSRDRSHMSIIGRKGGEKRSSRKQ